MSARPALTDDAIAAMLAERADRLVVPVDVGEAVRAANARPGRFGLPAVSLGLAAAAVAVVAVALAVGPVRPGPVASAQPTRLASAAASASTSAQVTPLTPAQLGKLARTRSAELDGRLAVVIGTVSVFVDGQCTTNDCTRAGITDGGDGWILRPTPEAGSSFPRIGRGQTGAFLVRFTSDVERQHPVVDLVAPLITDDRDRWTSTVATILSTDPGRVGDYAVIDGWLVHEPLHPCPSVVAVPPLRSDAPSYGCPDTEYLTDDRYQPLQADGSSIGSSEAIVLPVGSYDEWAPDPQVVGTGVEPRRAWYVVRKRDRSCGPTASCIDVPIRWGTIEGVIIPIAPSADGPRPSVSTDPPEPEVEPVSLGAPTLEAAAGIAGCAVTTYKDQVAGIAILVRASLLPEYVPLTGQEPEVQSNDRVFVVAYSRTIRLPIRVRSAGFIDVTDPTCIYLDGNARWFETGPWVDEQGHGVTPEPAPFLTKRLPLPLP